VGILYFTSCEILSVLQGDFPPVFPPGRLNVETRNKVFPEDLVSHTFEIYSPGGGNSSSL